LGPALVERCLGAMNMRVLQEEHSSQNAEGPA
jgi:hypothetical protein